MLSTCDFFRPLPFGWLHDHQVGHSTSWGDIPVCGEARVDGGNAQASAVSPVIFTDCNSFETLAGSSMILPADSNSERAREKRFTG